MQAAYGCGRALRMARARRARDALLPVRSAYIARSIGGGGRAARGAAGGGGHTRLVPSGSCS
ncbi:MAG: hypothetical protein VXY81_14720, partial [Pseudomonadota bacterium]|nr:hypothetical protein [Pseudomonadota bacterium]